MATRYYGAAIGAKRATDVTEAGSTTSSTFEFTVVYDASGNSRQATLDALEAIRSAIIQDTWPPA